MANIILTRTAAEVVPSKNPDHFETWMREMELSMISIFGLSLGTWNAATNAPTITSGSGSAGSYYVVGVYGTTTIDGTSEWFPGDIILFRGSTWTRIATLTNPLAAGAVGTDHLQNGAVTDTKLASGAAAENLGATAAQLRDRATHTGTQAISTVADLQTELDAKLPSASYTAADVLAKLLTVDGAGSGLDADNVDGASAAQLRDRSTHTGDLPNATRFANGGGSEGGQFNLAAPASGTTLAGDVIVDVAADNFRIFEGGGSLRGAYLPFNRQSPSLASIIRTTSDGAPRSILEWIDSALHTNILNGAHSGDLWTQIDSALDSGEDILLPRAGLAKITDRLDFVRQGQKLIGGSASVDGGFRLYCDADFNLAAPHVLGGAPFSHVENVFILFDQPTGATNKAALRAYPWAMSARAAQRSVWKNIGWGGAYNGFDGRGTDATNHPGGAFIHRVQDGALNIGGQFQDLYDFIDIDGWHGWEFGYSNLTNVRQINYTEPKYLIFGQNIEALSVGRLNLWMMTLNNQGSSIFKRSFGSVKLDGWASKFEWQNGSGLLSRLDILCDKNTDHNLILMQAGDLSVGQMNIRDTNAHNGSMIRNEGGRFYAGGGTIQSTGNGWHSETVGGITHLNGVRSINGGATARTLPFHKQTSTSGTLILDGCEPDTNTSGSGQFAVAEGSTGNRITNCDFKGYRLTATSALDNLFANNLNVGSEF